MLQKLPTVHSRHIDVEENEIRPGTIIRLASPAFSQIVQGLFSATCNTDMTCATRLLQGHPVQEVCGFIILDEKDTIQLSGHKQSRKCRNSPAEIQDSRSFNRFRERNSLNLTA